MMTKATAEKIEQLRKNCLGLKVNYEHMRELCYRYNTTIQTMIKYNVVVKSNIEVYEDWMPEDDYNPYDDIYNEYLEWDENKQMYHFYEEVQLYEVK